MKTNFLSTSLGDITRREGENITTKDILHELWLTILKCIPKTDLDELSLQLRK